MHDIIVSGKIKQAVATESYVDYSTSESFGSGQLQIFYNAINIGETNYLQNIAMYTDGEFLTKRITGGKPKVQIRFAGTELPNLQNKFTYNNTTTFYDIVSNTNMILKMIIDTNATVNTLELEILSVQDTPIRVFDVNASWAYDTIKVPAAWYNFI